MSRSRKTRKVDQNAPKLAPRQKKQERQLAAKKQKTGNKSGSRHNESLIQQQLGQTTTAKDPRHGSKKPVPLTINKEVAEVKKVKQPKLSDEQKLLKLEEDPRLNNLLDLLEEGRDLNSDDQKWLDAQLTKIEQLMDKLGINDAQAEEDMPKRSRSDDELFDKFESGIDLLKDYQ